MPAWTFVGETLLDITSIQAVTSVESIKVGSQLCDWVFGFGILGNGWAYPYRVDRKPNQENEKQAAYLARANAIRQELIDKILDLQIKE